MLVMKYESECIKNMQWVGKKKVVLNRKTTTLILVLLAMFDLID